MLCLEFENQLTDYIEGVVGPEISRQMAEHAMRCPVCHETLSAVRSTQQAIAQLASDGGDEPLLAVNQLTGLRDEHAVAALSSAASSLAADVEVRVSAVAALAQNALSSPAEETPSLTALRQLSKDGEPHVRDAARQTLESIEQQRRAIENANAKHRDSSGG